MSQTGGRAVPAQDLWRRDLVQALGDWCWAAGEDGRIDELSPEFECSTGLSPASLLGRSLIEPAHTGHDPAPLAPIASGKAFRGLILRVGQADGEPRWLELSGVPVGELVAEPGRSCAYRGIGCDVTAKILGERVLRADEQRFRQVLDAAADYYWEQNTQYQFTIISPFSEALFGSFEDGVFGRRLSDIPTVLIDPEMGKMGVMAHKAKQPFRDFIYSSRASDGKRRWYKVCGAPIIDEAGVFTGYRGTGAEITRNVEVTIAAGLAARRLNEAVGHVSQPIVVYDGEAQAVAYNQAFADLHQKPPVNTPVCQNVGFGVLAEWQIAQGFFGGTADDPPVTLDLLLDRYRDDAEHSYRLHDDRWMMVVYRSLPGGGRVGIWTDITAIKRAEAERRELEAQLHHSQRLEAIGTLAGGIAHEINNALVPTIALTKLVGRRLPQASPDRRNLELALNGAQRSRDLVMQILAFSRKGADRPHISVDVTAVLQDALRLMRATVPSSIRFEEEIVSTPSVHGDPSQIQQVIVNLINNAAQAIGQAQGRISVRLGLLRQTAQLCLSVADTGCGMDESTLARIFEPFFTTKPIGEGTGLGLSVAHGIIEAHGGRIEVQSRQGQGSRFEIFLPIAANALAEAALVAV